MWGWRTLEEQLDDHNRVDEFYGQLSNAVLNPIFYRKLRRSTDRFAQGTVAGPGP